MPASMYHLIAVPTAFWVVSVIACLIAVRWSIAEIPRRFWAAIIISASAIVIGLLGWTRFTFSFSKTVNGHGWSINSKWFFIFLIILEGISLALALWRRSKASQVPEHIP